MGGKYVSLAVTVCVCVPVWAFVLLRLSLYTYVDQIYTHAFASDNNDKEYEICANVFTDLVFPTATLHLGLQIFA